MPANGRSLRVGFVQLLGRRQLTMLHNLAVGAGGLLVLLGLTSGHGSHAQGIGDLLVAPTRVVFEGRTRSAQVTLVNKGTEQAVYRVTLERRRMLEDGRFEEVDEEQPGELFATDLIRFAPRRVNLEPNQSQTIRILVRKPRDLPAGEYRSHMLFRAIPDSPSGQSAESLNAPAEGLSIRLTPVFGVTIPVIVRHGNLGVEVSVSSAELQTARENEARSAIAVRLVRSGQRSIYGNVMVSLLGEDGQEQTIGQVRGVAVYAPNRSRIVRVPIDPSYAAQVKGHQIRVNYVATAKAGGRSFAENRFVIH